jgi:hypothetical protein
MADIQCRADRPLRTSLHLLHRSTALLLHSLFAAAALAQSPAEDASAQSLTQVAQQLIEIIATLSDYRVTFDLPPLFEIPQHMLEAKVCDQPCNVSAAYIPREGIYLAANLNPMREPLDRAVLLHELVHYLQQGHRKFAHLSGCARERAKEEEAYAIQNAYLASLGSKQRVRLYDGELDCAAGAESPSR